MKYFINNVSLCLVLDCSHVTLGAEIEKGSKAFQGQIKGFQNLVTVHAIEQNLLCSYKYTSPGHDTGNIFSMLENSQCHIIQE